MRHHDKSTDKLAKHIKRLRASGLFDENFYLAQSGPIPNGTDAVAHFVNEGERLNLNPSKGFNTEYCRMAMLGGNRHESPSAHYLSSSVAQKLRTQPLADEFDWPAESSTTRPRLVMVVEDMSSHPETRLAVLLMQALAVDWHVFIFIMSGTLVSDPFADNPNVDIIQHNAELSVGPAQINHLEVNWLSRNIANICKPDCVLALGANTWPLLPFLQGQLLTVISVIHSHMREPVQTINPNLFKNATRCIAATKPAAFDFKERLDAESLSHLVITPPIAPNQSLLLSQHGILNLAQAVAAETRRAAEDLKQLRSDAETLRVSGLFNSDFAGRSDVVYSGDEILRNYIWTEKSEPQRQERRPSPGFNRFEYQKYHPEIDTQDENAFAHYLRHGRMPGSWQTPIILPRQQPVAKSGLKVALHGHFYYPELLPEFFEAVGQNVCKPDLYLNVPNPTHLIPTRELAKKYKLNAVVRVFPNRGRDLAPFLTGFKAELFSGEYDVIGHIHGKKTPHVLSSLGDNWRNFLWQHLLGGNKAGAMLDQIVEAFEQNAKLGLVYPADPHLFNWSETRPIAETLAERMALEESLPALFDFPVGTMFWCRPAALARLFNLNFEWEHYPAEPIPNDATILHAIERILPFVCRADGFTAMNTHVPNVDWIFG